MEEYAQALFDNLNGWQDRTLERIGKRLKKTGRLSAFDQKTIKNITDITGDMNAIYEDLARVTGKNIAEVKTAFEKFMTDETNAYKPLYDFRKIPFVPYSENKAAQQLVAHWVQQTAGQMINLSRTKALSVVKYGLRNGERVPIGVESLQGAYQSAIDRAVFNVTSGTQDFYSAMRDTIEDMGGSGVRVDYGNNVTRSLDSVIRQNMLFAVKEMQSDYNAQVGKELGCDGFEVNFSATCRPSHAFMEGRMFSYNGDKVIDGVKYPDGAEALERLGDYNCHHTKTDVILGVSEPRYNAADIAEKNRKTSEVIEYDGKKKTRYEWIQKQREIERKVREQKTTMNMAKAAGDSELQKRCRDHIKALNAKYDDMTNSIGLQQTKERMRVVSTSTKAADVHSVKSQIPIQSQDEHYTKCVEIFKGKNVVYNGVSEMEKRETEDEIVARIAGADKTSGSCASVAAAYIGRKHGLDVLDFRGGESMEAFRSWEQLREFTQIKGMTVLRGKGKTSLTVGNQLLKQTENGKEYYLCVGRHAAIVRKNKDLLQYLELQSGYYGWKEFDGNARFTLNWRFGCTNTSNPFYAMNNFMVDINDKAFDSDEFKSLLGFINTNTDKQLKGKGGGIK